MSQKYPDHSKEINRIKRIQGQLEGVQRMIVENRYCPDILVQTKAITSAIRSLESTILEKHLNHCVKAAIAAHDETKTQEKVDELLDIFKKRLPEYFPFSSAKNNDGCEIHSTRGFH